MNEPVSSTSRWKISRRLQIVIVKEMHIRRQLTQQRKLSPGSLSNSKKNGEIIWSKPNKLRAQLTITQRQGSSKRQQKPQFPPDNGTRPFSYYNTKLQRQLDLSIVRQPSTMPMSDNMILLKNTLLNQVFPQTHLRCMPKLLNGKRHFKWLEKTSLRAKLSCYTSNKPKNSRNKIYSKRPKNFI